MLTAAVSNILYIRTHGQLIKSSNQVNIFSSAVRLPSALSPLSWKSFQPVGWQPLDLFPRFVPLRTYPGYHFRSWSRSPHFASTSFFHFNIPSGLPNDGATPTLVRQTFAGPWWPFVAAVHNLRSDVINGGWMVRYFHCGRCFVVSRVQWAEGTMVYLSKIFHRKVSKKKKILRPIVRAASFFPESLRSMRKVKLTTWQFQNKKKNHSDVSGRISPIFFISRRYLRLINMAMLPLNCSWGSFCFEDAVSLNA